MKKLILGASLGNCVHVAGIINFLRLAAERGYRTEFLGPAVSIRHLLNAVQEANPYMVAVSYRLTPDTGFKLLKNLNQGVRKRGLTKPRYVFGGTLPVAEKASKVGLFDAVFTGEDSRKKIYAFLDGKPVRETPSRLSDSLLARKRDKSPYPLIRHHFGLPGFKETVAGIRKIAASGVLDIISLGPDQNTQEKFFHPEEIDEKERGAGGVPIRSREELVQLYEASRRGNYPLMRCYSGTRDVFKMAHLLRETINNAWAAVPLCWYNQLDGRGPRELLQAIKENQRLMKWHAGRNIPVEVNEAHHWSLREAHDTVAVVMAYLAAYNARKMGVNNYIAQYMFNTPPATSIKMDIAKMLAKKELIEGLAGTDFKVLTQVRAGLASFPVDPDKARGQLALSTFMGMSLEPDIVHVVAYSEADHAAGSDEIIASCRLAGQVIEKSLGDFPSVNGDREIEVRKEELLAEAEVLLKAIKGLADKNVRDPWSDPETLERAIKTGVLDAPHLKNSREGRGILITKMVNGACYAYNYNEERIIKEKERINRLGDYI